MEPPITLEEQQESIEAFHSRKSKNALARMKPGTSQKNLLEKRLKATQIGAVVLQARWEDKGVGWEAKTS
jgi:hypothetical protein